MDLQSGSSRAAAPRPQRPGAAPRLAALGALLTLAMVLGTLVQFALGALAPFIIADLALSRAGFGLLPTAFFAVGVVCSPVAGPLVDRVGGRRMLLALFALAGVSLAGIAAAPGYGWLIAAVGVGGLATAIVNPVTNQLVAAHAPRGRQGAITGAKQSGVQIGAFLAGAVLPTVAVAAGWRAAVGAATVLAVAGAAATVAVLPRQRRPRAVRSRNDTAATPRFVSWLAAYAFLMGAGVSAAAAFLVLFAVEELGFSEPLAGLVAAVMGAVGIIARLLWARAAERAASARLPLAALAAGSILAQVAVWASPAVGGWLLWWGAAGLGASAGAWNAVGMLAIIREVDPASTGRASGLVQSGFYAGLLSCPLVFGYVVDATGSYDPGWAGVTVLFVLAAAVALAWRGSPQATPTVS